MRTRFAPSPTGWLHLGHAHAARIAFDFAKKNNGECYLRIEDTDHTRCNTDYTRAIYADLDWLGFDWPLPVRVQSQHYHDYAKVVTELIERDLAYPCHLTRSDIKKGQIPTSTNFDKDAILQILLESSKGEKPFLPFAIRLNLSKAIASLSNTTLTFEDTGQNYKGIHDATGFLKDRLDPVIARKDIGCAYMIAGPYDDALQGISHVVRGEDLFPETPLQILIQSLMDWPSPLYHHHGLILAETGEKLSKRNLDTALKSLKEAGQTPDNIWMMM